MKEFKSFQIVVPEAQHQQYLSPALFVNNLMAITLEADITVADTMSDTLINDSRLRHHDRWLTIACWNDGTKPHHTNHEDLELTQRILDLYHALTELMIPHEIAEAVTIRTALRRLEAQWTNGFDNPTELSARVQLADIFEEVCVTAYDMGTEAHNLPILTAFGDEPIVDMLNDLSNAGIRGFVPTTIYNATSDFYSLHEACAPEIQECYFVGPEDNPRSDFV